MVHPLLIFMRLSRGHVSMCDTIQCANPIINLLTNRINNVVAYRINNGVTMPISNGGEDYYYKRFSPDNNRIVGRE